MTKKDQKAMEVADQEIVEKEDSERTRDRQCFVPKTDIYETEDTIILLADLPGVSQDSVDIVLDKNVLTIDAYNSSSENKDYSVTYSEYVPGDYHRRFRLTREIDRDKIEAVVSDGVLELRLPKAEEAKVKKIPIKAG
ncbi:MAG: Hsp20/alpha crystallin family protein [Anaerolineales bacterium]